MTQEVLLFDEIYIGMEFPEYNYLVTSETIAKYGEAVEDLSPQYVDELSAKMQGFKGIIAHPTIAAIYLLKAYKIGVKAPVGGIHAKQSFEFHAPVFAGDTLCITAKVVDKFLKRERKYVIVESSAIDQNGESKLRSTMTMIWGK